MTWSQDKNRKDSQEDNYLPDKEHLLWDAELTEVVADCEIFLIHKTSAASRCQLKKRSHFHTISCGNWVNIIALTPDRKVVLIEQYRHGIRDLTMEIPGGCIDESDKNPEEAARRELLEETGFVSDSWTLIGNIHPNPAILNNSCYTFLAEDARQIEEPRFDGSGTEKICSSLLPLDQIDELIRQRIITHSLVVTAFHFLLLERPELLKTENENAARKSL